MTKAVNLALQGGGAHGAFAWGVLDALIEDGRLAFGAISGTSAGAMNAVVLTDGHVRAGGNGARDGLEKFWRRISRDSSIPGPAHELFDEIIAFWMPHGFRPLSYEPN